MDDTSYAEPKRDNTNKLIYKTETDSQTQRTNLWSQVGRCRKGQSESSGERCTADCYFTAQRLHTVAWQPGWEGAWGRMETCTRVAESLHCSPISITTLFIGYTTIKNKKFKKCYFNSSLKSAINKVQYPMLDAEQVNVQEYTFLS